jgi:hypothetical protein
MVAGYIFWELIIIEWFGELGKGGYFFLLGVKTNIFLQQLAITQPRFHQFTSSNQASGYFGPYLYYLYTIMRPSWTHTHTQEKEFVFTIHSFLFFLTD